MIRPSKTRATGPHFVTTPKSALAIPVATSVQYDAVIQTALHPAVTELSFVGEVGLGGRIHPFGRILTVRDGVRYVLDLPDGRTARTIDEEGFRLLAFEALGALPLRLTRSEIEAEPRCSNARLVWECCRHRVRMHARHIILDALDASGVLPVSGFDVRREDVFALACENAVDIDLTAEDIGAAEVRRSTVKTAPRSHAF